MNISLPESLKAWVDGQVSNRGYGTASEYIRQLLRDEQKRQVREQIDRNLLEALDSGEPIEVTPKFWEQRRKELSRRIKSRQKKKA